MKIKLIWEHFYKIVLSENILQLYLLLWMSECGVDIGPLRWRVNIPHPGTLGLIITPCLPSLLETGDRWRGVKGPGKYPIQSSPPTSGWWRCGVLKRSLLTNRSLLLHLYMQVMIFSIWNNYIICTVVVSKTSITNTRQSGSQLSLWLQLKLIWQRLRLY